MADDKEADLEAAFLESPLFGLEFLHEFFGKQLLSYIKSVARGLDVHGLDEVYQETFLDLLKKAEDPDFDWHKPLGIVFRIASTNAIDVARKKGFRVVDCDDADLPYLAQDFKGTRLYDKWVSLTPLLQQEFKQALNEVIDTLPPKQKTVAVSVRDLYPDLRERGRWGPIAQAVGDVLKTPENVASVKAAWHEAKSRIAEQLKQRGYEFLE